MRAAEAAAYSELVAAAGVEAERLLPGPARIALQRLVRDARADTLVSGIRAYAEAAHLAGEVDGRRAARATVRELIVTSMAQGWTADELLHLVMGAVAPERQGAR